MNDKKLRYEGKPLLKYLDSYVLRCIGCLDAHTDKILASTEEPLRKTFPHPGAWHEVIATEFGFDEALNVAIIEMWEKTSHRLSAEQFVHSFVDEYFQVEGTPGQRDLEVTSFIKRRDEICKRRESASQEALERKARSEQLLAQKCVPINNELPLIDDSTTVRIRTKEEVVYRVLALLVTACHAEANDSNFTRDRIDEYELSKHFTPSEREFIAPALNENGESLFESIKRSLSSLVDPDIEQRRTNFLWRYESAWVLLWSLGYVDELSFPNEGCDVPAAVRAVKGKSVAQILEEANLRSKAEILDEADLIYRYHWALVNARVTGAFPPAGLSGSVVYERHYALNWLTKYCDQEWDDVSTDT